MAQSISIEASAAELHGSERDRIIRKIKRCMALGSSSNKNESEMAMRQAQALMRSYRLSEADIHAEQVGSEERNTGLNRTTDWQKTLAGAAAQAFGCKLLIHRTKNLPTIFEFIGLMPAAELAAYAYDSLLNQVEVARKKFKSEYKATRRIADDFCAAWVRSVATKIIRFAKENPVPGTQCNALVLIAQQEEEAINEWISNRHGKVKTSLQKIREGCNYEAIKLGEQAGKQASIKQAVNTDSKNNVLMLA